MRAKTWAPIATFVAVAAVGATAALLQGGGSGHPQTLKLAAGGQDSARSAAAPGSGGGDYQLDVTLSADKPADQQAFTLTAGPADRGVVTRLADALHAGTPTRADDGWRAGGLVVSGKSGQAWSWSSCGGGPDMPVSSDGASGCAVAEPGTVSSVSSGSSGSGGSSTVTASPQPEPQPISESVVKDAVRDVLKAVGLDVDSATIDTSPYGGSATVNRPGTVGMLTSVAVDRAGMLTSAGGWLGSAEPGDRYPVISAKDAYDDLPALMHPDICRVAPDGQGCLPPEPTVITGAELGLSMQQTTDGGWVLVPSWLFQVKSGGQIAVIAVEPQYRSAGPEDTPATTDPGTNPGTVDPAPPAAAQVQIGVMAAKRGPKPDSVVVTYDNGGCGQENLQAMAKEDTTHVYVVLTADAPPPNQACTADSRPADVTIDLQSALADRQVIDTSTGKPVPLTS